VTGLSHLGVSSLLSYVIAVLLPAFDALIPVLPSETAVIALGVATAGSADPRAAVLVALAACGAFLGDNAAYLLGRRFGPTAGRRVFAGERFGARMIIGCRFIPGGRTAVTVTCGMVGYPRRRFVVATAFAAVIWASYAFLIGRVGGKAFEDQPWLGLVLALGITVAVSAAIEAARRARAWHLSSRGSSASTRSAHRLRRACTQPGCAGVSTRPVAAEDNHHTAAVQAADATAHPGRSAVAE
jgi:membrane protein DedA with SNARE-associated domain